MKRLVFAATSILASSLAGHAIHDQYSRSTFLAVAEHLRQDLRCVESWMDVMECSLSSDRLLMNLLYNFAPLSTEKTFGAKSNMSDQERPSPQTVKELAEIKLYLPCYDSIINDLEQKIKNWPQNFSRSPNSKRFQLVFNRDMNNCFYFFKVMLKQFAEVVHEIDQEVQIPSENSQNPQLSSISVLNETSFLDQYLTCHASFLQKFIAAQKVATTGMTDMLQHIDHLILESGPSS